MTPRRKKAPPHAEASESTVYLDRDAVGTVIVERKGRDDGPWTRQKVVAVHQLHPGLQCADPVKLGPRPQSGTPPR